MTWLMVGGFRLVNSDTRLPRFMWPPRVSQPAARSLQKLTPVESIIMESSEDSIASAGAGTALATAASTAAAISSEVTPGCWAIIALEIASATSSWLTPC